MKTAGEILHFLREHLPDYKERYYVASLGLFGSYSRGDQTEGSDIDILVDFEQPIGLEFIDLADEIEKGLGTKVDLVSRKAIKPRYWDFIEDDVKYA